MAKKNLKKTKSKIVSAAWKLFYEQGYEDTTIEEIIEESGTSKGSFYHYFEGKDALLGSLAYMMDEKYEELEPTIADDAGSYEVLLYLNRELLTMIEETINMELLTRLYSTQLTTHGDPGRCWIMAGRIISCFGRSSPVDRSRERSGQICGSMSWCAIMPCVSGRFCMNGVCGRANTLCQKRQSVNFR